MRYRLAHQTLWQLLIIGLIFNSTACLMNFTRTLESSQHFRVEGGTVGGAMGGKVVPEEVVVEEQIYREESFPDPRYERIYRVQTGARTVELGRYTDEGRAGMTTPPLFVADWLVVMSGAHIFFWQPDEAMRHFYPYTAPDWIDYADPQQLNGHYDYAATNVQITGDDWWITYTCTACLANHPALICFVSTDGGQTFRLE